MAYDQIWLIDEHPKEGYGAGPNIFSSDALALDLLLCFLFLSSLFKTLAPRPKYEQCST